MGASKDSDEKITLVSSVVMGAILSVSTVGLISFVVLLITLFNDGAGAALYWFGLILIFGCIAMLLAPLFGLLVSFSNKSWYAFKRWTASGVAAIALNLIVGIPATLIGLQLTPPASGGAALIKPGEQDADDQLPARAESKDL